VEWAIVIEEFDVILSDGEGYTVEFKESADKSLASEVCAFANASGGRVFVGVDDSGRVVGTDTGNTARSRIQDTINQIEPRLAVDIAVHDNIIVISVPEGTDKPYSCAKGFYLRSGPNSQKLERDGIIEFLQTEGRVIYDSIINGKHPITDNFSEAEYLKYLKMAGISNVLPRESVLKNLICAGIAGNGCLSYTNAGLLFFRDNTQELYFDFAHVICALYKGTSKVDIIDAKVLNGSIIENIDNAMIFLKRNLRERYEIKTVRRKNILELPEDALREAVTNAVCHRDYFEKGARVMVEIFDDRVEITNPGGAPKGITEDNFGNTSVTRNPVIASLLHRAHYIERMGTGILRINQAMETAGLKVPIFQTGGFFFKVIFERDLSLRDSVDVVKGGKDVVKGPKNVVKGEKDVVKDPENVVKGEKDVVKETLAEMIELVKKDGSITIPQMALLLNIGPRQVQRQLKTLADHGIITRVGGRKQGYWQVSDGF
jgi:ATP-dependent DNA helicase RecG